jgi:tetratricopeptide (TPR) repeat protein
MRNNTNEDLRKGLIVVIVGALIAFIATLCQAIVPIYFSGESCDFSVVVQPMNIEPVSIASNVKPSILELINPSINLKEAPGSNSTATVLVRNVHDVISPFRHPVYLKAITNDPDIVIDFEDSEGTPNFKTNMYVYISQKKESILDYPVIVQGIGGNGKIRNFTFYITYITPADNVRRGDNQTYMGLYKEAIKTFDKAISQDPRYGKARLDKGRALFLLGKYNESIQALDMAIKYKPDYAEAWLLKSFIFTRQDNYNESVSACRKVMDIDSNRKQLTVIAKMIEATAQAKYNLDKTKYYYNLSVFYPSQTQYFLSQSDYYANITECKIEIAETYNNMLPQNVSLIYLI